MIVHFIGGPAHGRSEAIQSPSSVVLMPAVSPSRVAVAGEKGALPPIPEFATVEYRIIRRTRRYCIAEFQPPKVTATVEVILTFLGYDRKVNDALSEWTMSRREEDSRRGDVRLVGVDRGAWDTLTLRFTARVDGPPDAVAAAEAGDKVQHYIDAALPSEARNGVTITQAGVSVE